MCCMGSHAATCNEVDAVLLIKSWASAGHMLSLQSSVSQAYARCGSEQHGPHLGTLPLVWQYNPVH